MSYGMSVYGRFSSSNIGEGLSPACLAWKKELHQDLESIHAVGDFAVHNIHQQFVNPGLEVAGCPIPLPLIPLLADQIKAVASLASCRSGDDTVVDNFSRLTWELNHDQFRAANPAWPAFLETIKQGASQSLGLDASDINVELDKLLLYEKGYSCRRHEDSDRTPGVVGRLILCLPSEHAGGQVHLTYAGKEHVFATALFSEFDLSSLAWYSDATHEVKEITAGHRLELTYKIIQMSGFEKSAEFFIKQQAQLKEKIARWPGDLNKLVHFLEHRYSQRSLSSRNLKGRDWAVYEVLSTVCSAAGIYVLFGNITKKECDQDSDSEYYRDDGEGMGIYLDYLCTAEGKKIASGVKMSEQHILVADPYTNRSADSESEGEDQTEEDGTPGTLKYHNSAVVLIPRNRIHELLGFGVDIWATLALFANDQKRNPRDASIPVDMLKLMDKILDFGLPPAGTMRPKTPGVPAQILTGLAVMRNAWNLKDIPLYRKAIRLGGLLDLPFDLTRIFAALNDFEKALEKEDFQICFRIWVAPVKRTKFESQVHLNVHDHDFIEELAHSLWHDHVWVEQKLIPKLEICEDRALVSKIIKTLADKDKRGTLPGSEEAARRVLNTQLQRLCLGPINLMSLQDQQAANEVDRFIELVGVCLASGFTDEALNLTQNIKPNPRQQQLERHHGPVHFMNQPNLALKLVRRLGDLLELHKAPFMESLRNVFEDLLRNYALSPFPVYPTRSVGWAHRPRGCNAACGACRDLDLFLTDPQQQVGRFWLLKKARDHVEMRLPRGFFRLTVDPGSKPHALLVYKISQDGEFREAVVAWERSAGFLQNSTKDLRKEHFRKILGDDLYRELVLLEGPPGSSISGNPAQSTGGVKREAEDELLPPPRSRPWMM
ncbi:hypothetical protein J7T55_009540 [Diaporthe amygdali]|uniref:uncharacterized protein n=1 Tax=Phomopsis amygdali TaxID=1214568 RepID=UPI0022FE4C27|nr:uncharacterized protein J7T55_009540 [Diaporthe amygdali]KAJ0109209.1 hypothetical protein J7T55_009540 [Diaporthe amygdali]